MAIPSRTPGPSFPTTHRAGFCMDMACSTVTLKDDDEFDWLRHSGPRMGRPRARAWLYVRKQVPKARATPPKQPARAFATLAFDLLGSGQFVSYVSHSNTRSNAAGPASGCNARRPLPKRMRLWSNLSMSGDTARCRHDTCHGHPNAGNRAPDHAGPNCEADFEAEAPQFFASDASKFVGGPLRPDEVMARGCHACSGHWAMRGYGFWGVEEKDTGTYVGHVGLWFPHRLARARNWLDADEPRDRQGLCDRGGAGRARAYAYDNCWVGNRESRLIDPDNAQQGCGRTVGRAVREHV